MKFQFLRSTFLAMSLAVSFATQAEDIDLFLGSPPAATTDVPNVLLFIDNTANWSTAFADEKAALVSTFDTLAADAFTTGEVKFNVGIVMFGAPHLGYVRAGLRPMNATNAAAYSAMVNSMTDAPAAQGGDKASARTLGRTVSEIYRYLTLAETVSTSKIGSNDFRDYFGNTDGTSQTNAVYALGDNPLADSNDKTYFNEIDPNSCSDIYVIYIGNNVSSGNVTSDNSSRNSNAISELSAAGGDTTPIPLAFTGAHDDNISDEWARFMRSDLGVKFYTVDVNPTDRTDIDGVAGQVNGMSNSAMIESMATQSDGKYFRVYTGDGGVAVAEAVANVLSEIQAVDSVFASVALPVSTTGQSIFLNQVFIGLFRPDESSYPRWQGNLKQYKLIKENNTIKLADAGNTAAVNSNTGFVTPCARSFWTPTSTDDYWAFNPQGDCLAISNSKPSNYPDGPIVEKGGQAYVLRSTAPGSRKIYTCDPGACSGAVATLPEFSTAAASASIVTEVRLGITSGTTAEKAAERNELINWMRGENNNGDEDSLVGTTDARPSIHGDVVHSRPVILNYGTDDNPEVVVFYGANDGMLRAINGNQPGNINNPSGNITAGSPAVTAVPGAEFWAFMPPEFYEHIGRLRANTDTIRVPDSTTPPGATGNPKSYGIDGPLTAYDGATDTYLYAGMRRSGRVLYAFDVTDPSKPKLKWKKGCPNLIGDAGCTLEGGTYDTAWSSVGQTWSAAKVTTAYGYNSGADPLLVMGGGYDDCEDADNDNDANHSCTTTTKGSLIYVLDGDTGNIQKTFSTLRGVVGNVTIVPVSKLDANIKYAYAADMGGNVYRISGPGGAAIGNNVVADWIITRIASLGCSTVTATVPGCDANRKFIFGPDVVEIPGSSALAILVGSGDREKPLESYGAAYAVENYFYSLVDNPTVANWLDDDTPNLCGGNAVICMSMLTTATSTITGNVADEDQVVTVSALSPIHAKGWKLAMETGEQVVTSALTVDNIVAFSSHTPIIPVVGSCENGLGRALTYNINFKNAAGEANQLIGGGIAPSPVAGKVILDDGSIEPFCIGCGGENSSIGGGSRGTGTSHIQPSTRVYWNIKP